MSLLLIFFETLTLLHWDMQRSVKLSNSLPCRNVELVGSIQKAFQHVTFQIKERNGFFQTPSLEALQYTDIRTPWSNDRAGLHSCLQGHCHSPLTSGKLLIVANPAKAVSKDYRMLWVLKEITSSNLQCKQWPVLETATQMSVCTFL